MAQITGSPDTIRGWADDYGTIAQAILDASAQLNSMETGDGQTSIAVLEYQTNAEYLAANIALAEPRYTAVKEALTHYANELEIAQGEEADAIAAGTSANSTYATAEEEYYRLWDLHENEQDPELKREYKTGAEEAWNEMEGARMAVGQAEVDVANAITRADNAGKTAASMIETAVSEDGMGDSWWDDIGQYLYEALNWICIGLLVIVFVAAVVLLVIVTVATGGAALIPGIIALIGIVGTVGTVLGVLMAAFTGIGMLEGEKGLGNQLLWDIIGLIPFSKYIKGPIGKLLRELEMPATGPGSISTIPTTVNPSQHSDEFTDALARSGPNGEALSQYLVDSNIDIFEAISQEAGKAITGGQEPVLPNLEPSTGAPLSGSHDGADPVVITFPLTGDSSPVREDPYQQGGYLPDYTGDYTLGGTSGPQPMPENGPGIPVLIGSGQSPEFVPFGSER